ncbi:nucleotidyltransferase domain-containing protein [Chromohalobacter sp. 48-RD10]|uniref:nucleotidyltransferase domain-containing protein n=1 Tax=Chromohalobacter sp. 48-RD10 TaxID=2994063 RepID=UPI00246996FF|nr:nucleotidyltransferase domain-containing protein [Chromohalobacter sp. 48-RD10]
MNFLVLKCGSAARGDANELSDIDFVCLHEDGSIPFQWLARTYPGVSFYSRSGIERMRSRGALFLTHIDVDGYPVEGEKRILDWIKAFRPPRESVLQSASETKKFIREIGWLPNSMEGRLWLCDILFVALRNFLYCANASNGIYRFGLESAISAFGLPDRYLKIFLKLRKGKYKYRSFPNVEAPAVKDNIHLLAAELAEQVTGQAVTISLGGQTDWSADWRLDYWGERLLERAIINDEMPDDGYRAMLGEHNYYRRVLAKEVLSRVKVAQQNRPTQ